MLNQENNTLVIVRAFTNDPGAILAYEPNGNFDLKNKQKLVKLLANAKNRQFGLHRLQKNFKIQKKSAGQESKSEQAT